MRRIMELKLDRDANGNKTVLVKFKGSRAFAIKTMGNLFYAHRMIKSDFDVTVVKQEVADYIEQYGSTRQQSLLRKYMSQL